MYSEKPNRNIEEVFEEADIIKVWEYLADKFGFNTKLWEEDFKKYTANIPGKSIRKTFIDYGLKKIQPLLNSILMRKQYHPTWNNMLCWLLKDKLNERTNITSRYKRR
jgi:hypothetical protein